MGNVLDFLNQSIAQDTHSWTLWIV